MTDSPETLKARRTWVETYRQTGNAGLTCRRCGISRPTLRKWVRRFEADGEAGLRSKSRRPHKTADSKRTDELAERVLTLRRERNLGSKRLSARHGGAGPSCSESMASGSRRRRCTGSWLTRT